MRRGLISAACGFVAFVALFPFSGDDSDRQIDYSVFGYEVPGGIWWPLAAGLLMGLAVWALGGRSRAPRG